VPTAGVPEVVTGTVIVHVVGRFTIWRLVTVIVSSRGGSDAAAAASAAGGAARGAFLRRQRVGDENVWFVVAVTGA